MQIVRNIRLRTIAQENLAANRAYASLATLLLCAAAGAQTAPPASAAPAAGAAPAPGAEIVTASGLRYLAVQEGKGPSPSASDTVRVHYRGALMDGTEFDSSYKRGQPAEFPLGHVIRCWTEGVQMMKVGGKAHLVCPPDIAYGSRGAGGGRIPPNSTLQFDVELLGIRP